MSAAAKNKKGEMPIHTVARHDRCDIETIHALCRELPGCVAAPTREGDLPLHYAGTPFQQRVWDALREIPYGETTSYARLARAVGRPSAVRAVASANGANAISILVPCHRVVGSDGSLTGYAGGLDAKAGLLALERAAAA